MTFSLFAYGSLMYPEIIRIALKRIIDDLEIRDAVLDGYRRVAIADKFYPTGIASPGSTIHGKLISGLSDDDLERLDRYEASFYVRKTVTVRTERGVEEVFAYIDGRNPLPFALKEWDQKMYEEQVFSREKKKITLSFRA